MSNQVTVYMYARAAKANKVGLHPIYVRITIQGKRTEFSTKKFITPAKWDPKTMKMKGTTEEARSINSYLESIKNKLTQTQIVLEYQGTELTLEKFMCAYLGKNMLRERTLIPIFQDHNNKIKALIGIDYSEGTHERYETSLKHTIEYIKFQYGTNDISISKIDHAFVTGYDFYLRTEKSCNNNTTVKYIKNFTKNKKILFKSSLTKSKISDNHFFYNYYKTNSCKLDQQFFMRLQHDFFLPNDKIIIDIDKRYTTPSVYIFANVEALEMTRHYLKKKDQIASFKANSYKIQNF
ncbi:RteC domain-containing protein [Sphingobacterium faecium]|uniref:RteC domain-containing protein n=1 Tax=Sphingobacterium faecium TaxID=34087 RepID=UPI003208071F